MNTFFHAYDKQPDEQVPFLIVAVHLITSHFQFAGVMLSKRFVEAFNYVVYICLAGDLRGN